MRRRSKELRDLSHETDQIAGAIRRNAQLAVREARQSQGSDVSNPVDKNGKDQLHGFGDCKPRDTWLERGCSVGLGTQTSVASYSARLLVHGVPL